MKKQINQAFIFALFLFTPTFLFSQNVGSEVVVNSDIPVVPVILAGELMSFTAESEDSYVQLNWATASENNNDYFNVERSIDGINYSSISSVNGSGNSIHILKYSSIDDTPLLGESYYRLKQTNYDGETSYSAIEAVSFKRNKDFIVNIYPNPVSSQITIDSESEIESIDIFNIYGSLVRTEIASSFSVENLSNGAYILIIRTKNVIVKRHFIKE